MVAAVPYLMLAAATASAAGSVVGGIQQQKADSYNADVADQEANTALEVSQSQAQQQQTENQERIGAALADSGASGVDPSQGSPLTSRMMTASQGELSRQLTLWQGTAQATSYRNQASLDTFQGNQAFTGGLLKGGATLLTAAGTYFGNPTDPSVTGTATGGGGGTPSLSGNPVIATPNF